MHISELRSGDCVHCETEEQALKLFSMLETIGITKWASGVPLIESDTKFSQDTGEGIYYYLDAVLPGDEIEILWDRKYDFEPDQRLIRFQELSGSLEQLSPQTETMFMEMLSV